MLKFIAGLMLGLCAVVALPTFALIGLNGFTERLNETLDRPAFSQTIDPTADDLERYAACMHSAAKLSGATVESVVDACRDQFRDWQDSPTFAIELGDMARAHPDVEALMARYENAHPSEYFD